MKTFAQILKFSAVVIFFLAGMVAVLIWRSTSRAERDWAQCKVDLKVQGFDLDTKAYIPSPVPDAQNFAMSPLLKPCAEYTLDAATHETIWKDDAGVKRVEGIDPKKIPELKELPWGAWSRYEPEDVDEKKAVEILKALEVYREPMGEMAEALKRPYVRFPWHYEEAVYMAMPQLRVLQNFGELYAARCAASLACGQTSSAYEDLQRMLAISNECRGNPSAISCLVHIASLERVLQVIWGGIRLHRWNEAQLVQIEKALEEPRLLEETRSALCADTAFSIDWVSSLSSKAGVGMLAAQVSSSSGGFGSMMYFGAKMIGSISPKAFVYNNLTILARMLNDGPLKEFDAEKGRVFPEREKKTRDALEAAGRDQRFTSILAVEELSVFSAVINRSSYMAEQVQLAILGCKLERYRLKHGDHPQALQGLMPEFTTMLPVDICNGQPLHYRREADDGYRLWSVGWNLQDDGGRPGKGSRGYLDRKTGDWVWLMPGTPAPD
jgi:hypothetical protein